MSIRVIPKSVKEETGHHALERLHHTPYRDEVRLFSCLQRGDLKKLIYELGQIGIQNITVGQMSENDLQQQKYMAVSFITLATHPLRHSRGSGRKQRLCVFGRFYSPH